MFNTRFRALFQNYFTKVSSEHADNEYNNTHSIQCGRADFETIINEKWVPCLQSSKSSKVKVRRPIANYSSLKHVLMWASGNKKAGFKVGTVAEYSYVLQIKSDQLIIHNTKKCH